MPYYPIFGKEIFIPLIDQDFYDAYDLTKKIDTIHTTKNAHTTTQLLFCRKIHAEKI